MLSDFFQEFKALFPSADLPVTGVAVHYLAGKAKTKIRVAGTTDIAILAQI